VPCWQRRRWRIAAIFAVHHLFSRRSVASDALDAGNGAARLFGARRPDSFRTKSTLCRYRMTGESQMDEARVAHVVGISFGLLWIAMLGLHMLSGT
jgi:hypothetical protein